MIPASVTGNIILDETRMISFRFIFTRRWDEAELLKFLLFIRLGRWTEPKIRMHKSSNI